MTLWHNKTGLIITLYWKKILQFNKLILFLRKVRFPLFFQFYVLRIVWLGVILQN